ncbi:MAG: hypothetical protein LUD78_04675 [Clostridiales bacterium]|nr:hypothetical protein [Clostridiales bacterium]
MFDKRNIFDSILSVFALSAGAVALALHSGPVVVLCGVILLAIGGLGLAFGNW